MKFDFNKISILFVVTIALITLFVYNQKKLICNEDESGCVCEEKVRLETSMSEGRLSINPYTYKSCKKVTQ